MDKIETPPLALMRVGPPQMPALPVPVYPSQVGTGPSLPYLAPTWEPVFPGLPVPCWEALVVGWSGCGAGKDLGCVGL